MAKQFRFPNYPRVPHQSGQARIKIRGKTYYLGKHGSPESHQEYNRLRETCTPPATSAAPVESSASPEAKPLPRGGLFVLELFDRFLEAMRAEHGEDWREIRHYLKIATVIDRVVPRAKVAKFGTVDLGKIQAAMINGTWMNADDRELLKKLNKPANWAASWTNHQITRIRTVFRWGESLGLVPRGTWEHLRALRGVASTRKDARHTSLRRPVKWAQVEAVMDYLPPPLAAAVELQWWTGARPSEILEMRARDITEQEVAITEHTRKFLR